jgi:biopolymer transport protein ExbB
MLNSILLQTMTATPAMVDTANKVAAGITNAMPITEQPKEMSISFFQLMLNGGPVMIPIGILLLLAIYFFIERLLAISRSPKADSAFIHNIKDMLSNGNVDAAKTLCMHTKGIQANMVGKGINRLGRPLKEIEESMQGLAQLELYRLEKNISVLSIVGKVAPMMGFIGTIYGVINIFYRIAQAGTVEINVVSEGLYQKMVSSASGLFTGILAFIFYYVVQMMVDKRVNLMETTSVEFLDILQEPNK